MARILISGYYGFRNTGDEALLEAMVSTLRHQAPGVEINVLSARPSETSARLAVGGVERISPAGILAALRRSDLLLSGGGTLLQDRTSLRSLVYYTSIILTARAMGKKVMLYANGIGPITTRTGRRLAAVVLRTVDRITLRDQESLEVVASLVPERAAAAEVTADPTFALEPPPRQRLERILAAEGIPSGRALAISLRSWTCPGDYVAAVAKAVVPIVAKRDLVPVILPMQFPADLEVSRRLARELQARGGTPPKLVMTPYHPREFGGLLGAARAVVAMRLHALIMGAANHTPGVGIIYDPKVTGFLKDMGLPTAGPVEHLDPHRLGEVLDNLLDREAEYRSLLADKKNRLFQRAVRNAELAVSLLP